jgi:hypothetical protein
MAKKTKKATAADVEKAIERYNACGSASTRCRKA